MAAGAALGFSSAAVGGARATGDFVAVLTFPQTINLGQTATITGWVSTSAGRVAGVDVTVLRYSTLHCTGPGTKVTVLTTGANGTFTFTQALAVTPPVAFGFVPDLAKFPTHQPNYTTGDACVNIGAGARLSATATGSVTVDGSPFKGGVIGYGSTVDLSAGSAVNLSTDVGTFKFYPTAGNASSFVPARVRLPSPKGKKTKPQFIIELRLRGDFSSCTKTKKLQGFRTEAATKKPPNPSLWGNGKGKYRTRGRYSSATVSGTIWLVQDRCDGTLTVVKRGVVRVKDFVTKKTVIITTGHRYLAKPR
jgi:hypothetical protein